MITSPQPALTPAPSGKDASFQRGSAALYMWRLSWLLLLAAVSGACQGNTLLTPEVGFEDVSRYLEMAEEIENPVPEQKSNAPALVPSAEPLRLQEVFDLRKLNEDQLHHLSIREATSIALGNSELIRNRHDFLSSGSVLLSHPERVASPLDLDIQINGANGMEAALSAFDLQLASGAQWGQNALVQNAGLSSPSFPRSDLLVNDSGSVFARIDKSLSTGSLVSLVHNWNYSLNNLPQQSYNTRYAGFLRAELRHPLWAGSGRDFTSISGPTRYGSTGLNHGVALAEVDNSIAAMDLELQIQTQTKQTEELYWELWLAIQSYRSQVTAEGSAHRLWKKVQGREQAGLDGGSAADVAQAEENYLERKNLVNAALTEVFEAEGRLRRMLGLPVNDGKLLWPVDQPMLAEFLPDWEASVAEGLTHRMELVQQNLRIESLELQLRAAKSLTHPQLDVVSGAQLNGFGNELIDGSSGSPGAYPSILDPDQAGWNVGLEFSMPLGFRLAHARVRNLQYRIAKARAVLNAQEQEIEHELSHCIREMDRWFAAMQTAQKIREVATRRLQAVEADYDAGRATLDLLVRTQISLMQAEIKYAQSVAAYNRTLLELQFRKGMIFSVS